CWAFLRNTSIGKEALANTLRKNGVHELIVLSFDGARELDVEAYFKKLWPTAMSKDGCIVFGPSPDGLAVGGELALACMRETFPNCMQYPFGWDYKRTRAVAVWDLEKGAQLVFHSYDWPVSDFIFSRNGQTLATACLDGCIRLFAIASGELVQVIDTEYPIDSLQYFDEKCILGRDITYRYRYFDVSTGRECDSKPIFARAHESCLVSSNRNWAALKSPDSLRLKSLTSAGNERIIEVSQPFAVTFSLDEKLMAVSSSDKNVQIFDVSTGEKCSELKLNYSAEQMMFSADCKRIFAASISGENSFYRLEDGSPSPNIKVQKPISCNAKFVSAYELVDEILISKTENGDTLTRLNLTEKPFALAFSEYETDLAIGGMHGQILVSDVASGDLKFQTRLPDRRRIDAIALSPDGSLVACAQGQTVFLYHTKSGEKVCTFGLPQTNSIRDIAFSPDGNFLAAAEIFGYVFQLSPPDVLETVIVHDHLSVIKSICFSSDSQYLITGSTDKIAKVTELRSGMVISSMLQSGFIDAVSVSGDGFAASLSNIETNLWSLETGKLVRKLEHHGIRYIDVKIDRGVLILFREHYEEGYAVEKFDAGNGKLLGSTFIPKFGKMAASRSGSLIATYSQEYQLTAYDWDTGTRHCPTNVELVDACASIPETGTLVIGTKAGEILVYDENGKVTKSRIATGRDFTALAVSGDGKYCATGYR
ncbi:MAG: hypothetical protein K8F91_07345, partial [Candidatus Obscuribacterales bacterium]|nr:hypothetical protein [Candidatus Obscuribacterales bacterium]